MGTKHLLSILAACGLIWIMLLPLELFAAERLYFVPKVFDAVADRYVPKYFGDQSMAAVTWSGRDFDDWYVISAELGATEHSAVVANLDAFAFPVDLSANVPGGHVAAVRAVMESANLPNQWVNSSRSWAEALRGIFGMIALNQRFKGQNNNVGVFSGGVNLDRALSTIPSGARTTLQEAALSLNLDVSSVTGTTTVREFYQLLGQQFLQTPIRIGTVVL